MAWAVPPRRAQEAHASLKQVDVCVRAERLLEPGRIGSHRHEADDGTDVAGTPLLMGSAQPSQQFAEGRVHECERARPVIRHTIAALAQEDAAGDDRAEDVGARIEVDLAEGGVDAIDEVGRREPTVPSCLSA